MARNTKQWSGPKGQATRLHSQLVRAKGFCEACGSTQNLQCAHIISRRYSHTRTDERNAFCLCARCHYHFTDHPVEFGKFVLDKIGPVYDQLLAKSQLRSKVDWEAEVERLRTCLGSVDAATSNP